MTVGFYSFAPQLREAHRAVSSFLALRLPLHASEDEADLTGESDFFQTSDQDLAFPDPALWPIHEPAFLGMAQNLHDKILGFQTMNHSY